MHTDPLSTIFSSHGMCNLFFTGNAKVSKMNFFSSLVIASLLATKVRARVWTDVIDTGIYATSMVDRARIEHAKERNPFYFGTNDTPVPTFEPTSAPYMLGPTLSPSASIQPTTAPSPATSAPTARYDNVDGNGGCASDELLYEIRMHDSWGDGWDGTVMTISKTNYRDQDASLRPQMVARTNSSVTMKARVHMYALEEEESESSGSNATVFQGSLLAGSDEYEYICLKPDICYNVDLQGGDWTQEITWEIRAVQLGISREEAADTAQLAEAKGLAPVDCRFSIPNISTGDRVCINTCERAKTKSPTLAPAAGAPSSTPTIIFGSNGFASAWPSDISSSVASDSPSSFPSDVPTYVPTQAPRKKRIHLKKHVKHIGQGNRI